MQAWSELVTPRPCGLVRPIFYLTHTCKHSEPHIQDLKNVYICCLSGMKLTLSALVDGKNINAGGHKLGLGLELEA